MGFKHGEFQSFADEKSTDQPFNNLLLTMLQQADVKIDSFGDSNGTLKELVYEGKLRS